MKYMNLQFDITCPAPKSSLPEGFLYVSQDNYYLANLDRLEPQVKYLYSDSATSCIIVIIEGKNALNEPIVALAHLSRTLRYDAFFSWVANANFVGPVRLCAQGANPRNAEASIRNVNTLLGWMQAHSLQNFETATLMDKPGWFVEEATLSFGQGNPNEENRGCYGIDLARQTVSNHPFELKMEDRDHTGGVQTLFAVFGMKVWPPLYLWEAGTEFPKETIDILVKKAMQSNWTKILDMSEEQILANYSSTPECEPEWFAKTLKQSAEFVKNYVTT